MPNATVRADAQTMPRRLFLAAGPAAAVFATLRGAKAVADTSAASDSRLFELIAQGKHWWEEIGHACDLPDPSPEREAKLTEAHSRYQDAFDEAVETAPQTVAGVRALLAWVKTDCEGISLPDENVASLVGSLLASPVLAMEA
jgi:hypothetical protein